MVNLHRYLVFCVALLSVEVTASEWKLIEREHQQSVDLEMRHSGSTASFSCIPSEPKGYLASYAVPVPNTSATIVGYMDAIHWLPRMWAASNTGKDFVALGKFVASDAALETGLVLDVIVTVPLANFVEAFKEFESDCEKRRASL